jgi:DNA-binding MarR family transcriptional regulator
MTNEPRCPSRRNRLRPDACVDDAAAERSVPLLVATTNVRSRYVSEVRYKRHMTVGPSSTRGSGVTGVDTVIDAVLRASRLLIGLSARSIAAVDESITLPQFRLLVVLSTRGPLNLAALAEHLDVKSSTATRMIDRLITAGLVEREVNPISRREVVIDLTGTGASVVTRVTQLRRREIAGIVANMPAPHRKWLVDALEAFSQAGSEPVVDGVGEPAVDDWV